MKNHGESLGTAGRTIKDPVSTRPSLHVHGPTAAFLLPGGTDVRSWIVLAGLLGDSLVDGSIVAIENRHFYARASTSSSGIAVEIVSVAAVIGETVTATPDEMLDTFTLPAKERAVGSSSGLRSELAPVAAMAAFAFLRGGSR